MEELEGKRGAGEDGHRGEGGTWERGEKRGVPSPGVWGWNTWWCHGWMRWELAWITTRHPQHPAGQGAGLGQPGQEHHTPKPIKFSRGH